MNGRAFTDMDHAHADCKCHVHGCCTGHVMLNRVDKRSQLKCLGDCRELLQKGASVLFFPEGTRSKDGRMADFKKVPFYRNLLCLHKTSTGAKTLGFRNRVTNPGVLYLSSPVVCDGGLGFHACY